MSLAIKDTSSVPPETWLFYVAATNFTVSTRNYSLLYPKIVEHCRANNVGVPSEQEVVDQMCRDLHISCYDAETHTALINKLGLPFVPPPAGCCGSVPAAPKVEEIDL